MNTNKIEQVIKCIHCDQEMIVDSLIQEKRVCSCGKVSTNGGVIIEGAQGVDWIDVSSQLLNE